MLYQSVLGQSIFEHGKKEVWDSRIQELRIPLETVELQLTIHSTVTTVSGLLVPSDLTGFAQALHKRCRLA